MLYLFITDEHPSSNSHYFPQVQNHTIHYLSIEYRICHLVWLSLYLVSISITISYENLQIIFLSLTYHLDLIQEFLPQINWAVQYVHYYDYDNAPDRKSIYAHFLEILRNRPNRKEFSYWRFDHHLNYDLKHQTKMGSSVSRSQLNIVIFLNNSKYNLSYWDDQFLRILCSSTK